MRYLNFIVLLFILFIPFAAQAQRVGQAPGSMALPVPSAAGNNSGELDARIAAVVNDTIISTADVRARTDLAMLTSGLPDSPEVRQKLLPQVLHSLIDEQLQLQEGKKLDITISQDEIQTAMKRISTDNNVPGGDIVAFLGSHGVPPSTLVAQAKAALTWNKVAQRELRPRVDIGEDEIDAVAERMRANAGKQEFLVSEILLTVDNPADEERVKSFAENLVQQIKAGATFGAMARQFSQGTGAASGGDIGWIQAGQMPPELDKVLEGLGTGEIAGPIRLPNGFHIIGVRDKRTIAVGDTKEMTVNLQQVFLPFTPEQNKEALLKEADRLRQTITVCTGLADKIAHDFPAWHWQDLGEVKLAEAPGWLAEKVRDIGVGRASEPMATDKGALIIFVCGRKVPENINREEIMSTIGTERIELLARRLLRDFAA